MATEHLVYMPQDYETICHLHWASQNLLRGFKRALKKYLFHLFVLQLFIIFADIHVVNMFEQYLVFQPCSFCRYRFYFSLHSIIQVFVKCHECKNGAKNNNSLSYLHLIKSSTWLLHVFLPLVYVTIIAYTWEKLRFWLHLWLCTLFRNLSISMYSLVPICEIQLEILMKVSAAFLWVFVIRSAWRVASFNLNTHQNTQIWLVVM